ncbi:unnamed protein product, partial [Gadus morhua 'NCC']
MSAVSRLAWGHQEETGARPSLTGGAQSRRLQPQEFPLGTPIDPSYPHGPQLPPMVPMNPHRPQDPPTLSSLSYPSLTPSEPTFYNHPLTRPSASLLQSRCFFPSSLTNAADRPMTPIPLRPPGSHKLAAGSGAPASTGVRAGALLGGSRGHTDINLIAFPASAVTSLAPLTAPPLSSGSSMRPLPLRGDGARCDTFRSGFGTIFQVRDGECSTFFQRHQGSSGLCSPVSRSLFWGSGSAGGPGGSRD